MKLVEQTRFEKYPDYKDSGEEWLGQIPEKWVLRRFKFLFKEINERSKNGHEDLLSVSQYTGVTKKSDKVSDDELLTTASTLEGYKKVYKGDLVSNIMLAWNGSLGFSPFNGITSPAYSIYRLNEGNNKHFFHYLVRSQIYKAEFKRNSSGVIESRLRLYTDDFFNILSLHPPLQEQTAIANFLDEKTQKIDGTIAKKQKLITLLKERKQILIQQAVTKGLDPNVTMKDSGIDWIGEIPEHWEVIRFKNLFIQSRLSPRSDDGTVTSYRDGQVTLRSNRRLTGYTEAVLEHGFQGIRIGQLVLNSMDAFEGAIGVSDSDGKCTPEYIICDKIHTETENEYYAFLLREMALAKYIQVICNAVRQRAVRIRYNNLASRFIAVPPFNEQTIIVEHIKKESKKIESGITKLKSQIEKLKEYKSVLIDSAVTGKIKIV